MANIAIVIPDWIDAVRASIKARQQEIAAMEQGRGREEYEIVAAAVRRFAADWHLSIELAANSVMIRGHLSEGEPMLGMLSSMAKSIGESLVAKRLRNTPQPLISARGSYWAALNLSWSTRAGTKPFTVGIALSASRINRLPSDMRLLTEERTTTEHIYTITDNFGDIPLAKEFALDVHEPGSVVESDVPF